MLPPLTKRILSSSFCFILFVAIVPVLHAQQSSADLDSVLNRMDSLASTFKSAQADFVWDQYEMAVNSTDTQQGKIYFRRKSESAEMTADIGDPAPKKVLFQGDTVRVYEPKIDRLTIYNLGKNKADFESYLLLGFGGRGHDLQQSFDVKYLGREQAQGVNAAKLELVPKSASVRNNFNRILLWIDMARGVSVQQQFFAPLGDYRLAKYSNIQINASIPDSVFKLKTTSKTEVVKPQG